MRVAAVVQCVTRWREDWERTTETQRWARWRPPTDTMCQSQARWCRRTPRARSATSCDRYMRRTRTIKYSVSLLRLSFLRTCALTTDGSAGHMPPSSQLHALYNGQCHGKRMVTKVLGPQTCQDRRRRSATPRGIILYPSVQEEKLSALGRDPTRRIYDDPVVTFLTHLQQAVRPTRRTVPSLKSGVGAVWLNGTLQLKYAEAGSCSGCSHPLD